MIMVTGGAYQGKTEYVMASLGVTSVADSAHCDFEEVMRTKCIGGYHELVKRLISDRIDPMEFTERLCRENPDAIVIIDEIGSGIIPIEKNDRTWREAVGRCGCVIAQKSDLVVRLVCGIPTAIKGELP